MKYLSLFFLFLLSSTFVFAQSSLSIDRAGSGNSAYTVPVKSYQFETGLGTTNDALEIGQILFRTGITENLEFRFNTGSVLYNINSSRSLVSAQSAGFKYSFSPMLDEKLDLGIQTDLDIPFLNENYEYWLFRFIVLADYAFNDKWSLN